MGFIAVVLFSTFPAYLGAILAALRAHNSQPVVLNFFKESGEGNSRSYVPVCWEVKGVG